MAQNLVQRLSKPCAGLSNTLSGLPMAQNLVGVLSNALFGLPMAKYLVGVLSNALFGLPMAQNLVRGLSNTLFGLSIAQNLVWGCQILLLDYGWPKPFAYSKQDYYWKHSQLDTEQKNSA